MPWSSLWNSARRIPPDAPVRFLRFEGITFAHNHLHNLGHALLSDIGGIYTLGVSLGTRLVGNVIHDIKARAYGGWGIYPDEGSSQIVIASNLVYRCSSAPYFSHINRKITVQNNIFTLGEQCQVERAGAMSALNSNTVFKGTSFTTARGNWSDTVSKMVPMEGVEPTCHR